MSGESTMYCSNVIPGHRLYTSLQQEELCAQGTDFGLIYDLDRRGKTIRTIDYVSLGIMNLRSVYLFQYKTR